MRVECLFCNPRERKVFETELFYAQFDAFPVTPGHAEIIPRRHVVSLMDLTDEEWSALKPAIRGMMQHIESTDLRTVYTRFLENPINGESKQFCEQMLNHVGIGKRPDAYNFGVNDGKAAGRTIDHLHIHIIPRYDGDMADPRGGVRHVIPEMGNYKK